MLYWIICPPPPPPPPPFPPPAKEIKLFVFIAAARAPLQARSGTGRMQHARRSGGARGIRRGGANLVLGGGDEALDALLDGSEDVGVRRLWVGDEHRLRLHHRLHDVQSRGAHRRPRLDEVHHRVRQAQPARRLHAPADKLNLGLARRRRLVLLEEPPGEVGERGDDSLAGKVGDVGDVVCDGGLHRQFALAKTKSHDHFDLVFWDRLRNDIQTGYSQVHITFADIRCNICSWEENQGDLPRAYSVSGLIELLHKFHDI